MTETIPATPRKTFWGRDGSLDLLLIVRGLAAVAVIIWHAGGYQGGWPLINVPGRTAVWLFFGISGYVIAHGFINGRYGFKAQDIRDFYCNRFLRIYPIFILLSIVAWVTEWATTGINPIGWSDVPSQFFSFQFNQNYKLSGVFWTLGIEMQFYLIAPLLLFFICGRGWVGLIPAYAAMVYANKVAVAYDVWSLDGRNLLATLPHFMAGIIACRLALIIRVPSRAIAMGLIPLALILLIWSNWWYHTHASKYWSSMGIVLVDGMIFLLAISHAELERTGTRIVKWLDGLTFLGVISYGLYAWHAYLLKFVPAMAETAMLLLVCSVCAASLSYRLLEVQVLRFKRRPIGKPPSGPA